MRAISFLKTCDELIRNGKLDAARNRFKSLRITDLEFDQRSAVADLARRLGLYNTGLRLMRPVIHNVSTQRAPTPSQFGIYAALLTSVGAFSEALKILQDRQDTPENILYHALVYNTQRDYAQALPLFEKYLTEDISAYDRNTANLYIAAAHTSLNQPDRAEPLVLQLLDQAKRNEWDVLLAGAVNIAGRLTVARGDWQGAVQYLDDAERLLFRNGKTPFFIFKWRTLIPLMRDGATSLNLAAVEKLRTQACIQGHWGTVRDCDYRKALALHDENLLQQVYFGTPFVSYRQQISDHLPLGMDLGSSYILGGSERVLDIESGKTNDDTPDFKAGQKLHLMFRALSRDLYQPVMMGTLATSVFHDEYYDPWTSSKKTVEVIRRLRSWLKENHWGVRVLAYPGAYKLNIENTTSLKFSQRANSSLPLRLEVLREEFGSSLFSVDRGAKVLNLSPRSLNLLLKEAIEAGQVIRLGKAKSTKYKFAS